MKLLRPPAVALLLAVALPACDAPDDTTGDEQDATPEGNLAGVRTLAIWT